MRDPATYELISSGIMKKDHSQNFDSNFHSSIFLKCTNPVINSVNIFYLRARNFSSEHRKEAWFTCAAIFDTKKVHRGPPFFIKCTIMRKCSRRYHIKRLEMANWDPGISIQWFFLNLEALSYMKVVTSQNSDQQFIPKSQRVTLSDFSNNEF